MSRAIITLRHNADRKLAIRWIEQSPVGMRIEYKAPRRTIAQNSLLWAKLTDLSVHLRWHGKHLTANDYKILLLDALQRETTRVVPNVDGTGFVDLGRSSSDLSKEEMGQFLDLIDAFGAQHGVIFNDQAEQTSLAPESETEMAEA